MERPSSTGCVHRAAETAPDNPPQLARLVIGSLPSLTEELGPRERYSLIVLVRDKPCE